MAWKLYSLTLSRSDHFCTVCSRNFSKSRNSREPLDPLKSAITGALSVIGFLFLPLLGTRTRKSCWAIGYATVITLISLPKELWSSTIATVTTFATAVPVTSFQPPHERSVIRTHGATGYVRLMRSTTQLAENFTSTTSLIPALFGAPRAAKNVIHQSNSVTRVKSPYGWPKKSADTGLASLEPSSS